MKTKISTKHAPTPIGPYSQGIYINNFLYISGQIALNAKTEKIVYGSIDIEMNQVMKNIYAILKESNMDFNNVIKVTIFVKNINNIDKINEIYMNYFINKDLYPAREIVEVSGLPKNSNIEISVVAHKN